MTLYRKVFTKDRLPTDNSITYDTDKGRLFIRFVIHCKWWLEEIKLPTDEEIEEKSHSEAWSRDMGLELNNSFEQGYTDGANYILNKLKG